MFRKILKISEKVLLVICFLAYLITFVVDVDDDLFNATVWDIVDLVLLWGLLAYCLIVPLKKISNLMVFLTATYILAILGNLFNLVEFSDIPFTNLFLFAGINIILLFKSFFLLKKNIFLKGLIIAETILFLLFWATTIAMIATSENEYYFLYPVFIVASLAMIFGFSASNYSEWNDDHKKIFIRAVLTTWILLFVLSATRVFISNDHDYRDIFMPKLNVPWNMHDYPVGDRPGLLN